MLELEPVLILSPDGRLHRNSRWLPPSLPLIVQEPFAPTARLTVSVERLALVDVPPPPILWLAYTGTTATPRRTNKPMPSLQTDLIIVFIISASPLNVR